ncbi:hypothetical protein N665_0127s0014 [Sinapis alba]|nr:hypothetical protein N665_0127s0014 [Sinapis alba]
MAKTQWTRKKRTKRMKDITSLVKEVPEVEVENTKLVEEEVEEEIEEKGNEANFDEDEVDEKQNETNSDEDEVEDNEDNAVDEEEEANSVEDEVKDNEENSIEEEEEANSVENEVKEEENKNSREDDEEEANEKSDDEEEEEHEDMNSENKHVEDVHTNNERDKDDENDSDGEPIKPLAMYFPSTEYGKKIKILTRYQDVKAKIQEGKEPSRDRLRMLILYFMSSIIVGRERPDIENIKSVINEDETLLDRITEPEDINDKRGVIVESWMKRLARGYVLSFEDIVEEDVPA